MFPRQRWHAGAVAALAGIPEPAYESEALAIFAAAATPPVVARKIVINTCVKALKDGGAWSLFDFLYVTCAADAQIGALNWVSPGSYTLTAVNSPSFTADRGWLGNGSSSYLATGWDAATDGVHYTRDDGHFGMYGFGDPGSNGNSSSAGTGTSAVISVRPRNSAVSGSNSRINSGSTTGFSSGASSDPMHAMGIRRSSGTQLHFEDGAQVASGSVASVALTTDDITILKLNNGFTARRSGIVHIGGAPDDTQAAALYAALHDYAVAVGYDT